MGSYQVKAGKTVYQVKCEAERNRDVWEIDVCKRDDQKFEVLKIVDRMIKTNQVVFGKQRIRNENNWWRSEKISWEVPG